MSEVTDRDEIRQLIATYTAEGDRGRVDRMAHIFAEDATMVIPSWRAEGRAGIVKALSGGGGTDKPMRKSDPITGRGPIMRHHLTSCYITFDGPDDATGRTYWINFSENGPDHSGLYADKYRRIDGRWLITHREVRLDWKSPNSWNGPEVLVGPRPAHLPPVPVIVGD
jgi:hypothetical protein